MSGAGGDLGQRSGNGTAGWRSGTGLKDRDADGELRPRPGPGARPGAPPRPALTARYTVSAVLAVPRGGAIGVAQPIAPRKLPTVPLSDARRSQ